MDQNSFGEKLRQLRISQGMTLEQVAVKVGVGKSTVRKWEIGMIENMRRDKIVALAAALGTTVEDILSDNEGALVGKKPLADNGERLTESEQVLINAFRHLSQDRRDALLRLVLDLPKDE